MAMRWTDEELVRTLVALVTSDTTAEAIASLGADRITFNKRLPDMHNLFCARSLMECLFEAWATGRIKKYRSAKQVSSLSDDELAVLELLAADKTLAQIQKQLKKSPAWVGERVSSLKAAFELKEGRPPVDKHALVYAALSCGIKLSPAVG